MPGYPGLAWKNRWQYGREATYGSATVSTFRAPTYSLEVNPSLEVIEPDLSDASMFTKTFIDAAKRVTVQVEGQLTYSNMGLLIDCAMGTAVYNTNGGSSVIIGGGPNYTHTWKQQEILNALTLQNVLENFATTTCERVVGAKVARLVLRGSGQQNDMRYQVTFQGKDWATNITPTNVARPTVFDPIMFKHLSTWDDGGGDGPDTGEIRGWELTIDNGLAIRDYGKSTIDEPIRNRRPIVTLALDIEFQTRTARDSHINFTVGSPHLNFQSSASRQFDISLPLAYMKEPPTLTRDGMGIVTQRLVWSPISDGGSPESYLTLFIINAQSTITTYS